MFLISKGILKELPVVVLVRRWGVLQGKVDPCNHHLKITITIILTITITITIIIMI